MSKQRGNRQIGSCPRIDTITLELCVECQQQISPFIGAGRDANAMTNGNR